MSSEKEFEEWFSNKDMPIDISLFRTQSGFILRSEMTPILREGAMFSWNYQQTKLDAKDKEVERLRKENEKLRKCAEFYANRDNWLDLSSCGVLNTMEYCDVDKLIYSKNESEYCCGKLARYTLKEL